MPGSVPENQVSEQTDVPEPTSHLTADVPFDSPIGAATEQAGVMALRAQRYADWSAHIAAVNQYEDSVTKRLEDPKTGLLNQNAGNQSPELADKTLADLNAQRSAIRDSLGNERQKAMFDRTSDEHFRMAQRRVFAWEHGQQKQAEEENFKSTLANSQARAVTMSDPSIPRDPVIGDPVEHEINVQTAAIKDYAAANGVPNEMRDYQIAQAKSKTYLGVVDDMLAKNNVAGAKALMEEHGEDIASPSARRAVSSAIDHLDNENQAQSIANGFLKPGDDKQDVTLAQFRDKLIADPALAKDAKLYDAVQRRGEQYFALKREADRAEQQQTASDVYKSLIADPTIDPQQAAGAVQWQKLDGETQASLMRAKAQMVKREGPQEFSQDYYDLRRMVGTPAFEHVNLMQYSDKLPPSELKEMAGYQASQAKKDNDPKLAGVITDNTIVSTGLHKLFKDDADNTRNSEAAYAYRRAYDLAVQEQTNTAGKPPDVDARKAIADNLVADHAVQVQRSLLNPARWFGSDTTTSSAKLYTLPDETIRSEARANTRIGGAISQGALDEWTKVLRDPQSPNFADSIARLKEWQNSRDPLLRQQAAVIRAELENGNR